MTQPYLSHFTTTASPPSPLLQFATVVPITLRPSNNFNTLRSRRCFRRRQNSKLKVTRGSVKESAEILEAECAELPAPTCITRSLPPALTLEHGLQKIKDAVYELKSNPPRSRNGMCRFQVAVPPSPKALDWFCCQPQSSEIFPIFFLSKEMCHPPFRPLSLSGVRGVFGIGANLLFKSYSSFPSAEWNSFKRYLSADPAVVAYGFPNSSFDVDSSSVMHNRDSFYLFIPQIELDELEGISVLATTLVWGDSFFSSFEEAILSLELVFSQIIHNFLPTPEKNHENYISSCLRKFNAVEDVDTQMVRISALSLIEKDLRNGTTELKNLSTYCRFSIRLSDTLTIANNLGQLDGVNKLSDSIQNCPNINTLWASLIVEECCRLGLTYFCIAPGSRSSPLAIAASTHSLTTCIACFDERSLAFHAVGYGRGSHKPAVVITSSGTAVSNLLPAVVEASEDFVPLLLLTADRPPELQDTGANQAINQVNHFGQFSRFFYGLPAPTDAIPARMVLTTVDSAVHWATSSPSGPVHINCPFREPLDGTSTQWMLSCLKGLDIWSSSFQPFTNYIQLQYTSACNIIHNQLEEVLKVVRAANKGFLLIGKIHREDEIWAALLLAMHLQWPVITDILSGLRLRKYETQFQVEKKLVFIDYMDHSLLSKSVKDSAQADVIVQIGSKITSKRISQMIEDCFPLSYILVENHPFRNDPSHIVTHRIQSTITHFVGCFLQDHMPAIDGNWCAFLQDVDKMVAWEISFLIHSESSLTEPYVAHMISEAVRRDSAIFVGNSMAIRDADMYGANSAEHTTDFGELLSSGISCHWIKVAGNRGASGIDGLLSTATGFAVGCDKRVICLLGDVSFLHDTNGLALLKQRICRKPMTVVVINNHGGAIFSLLPIADRTERRVLDQYFYTTHDVSIECLSLAHGLKHVQVKTKLELQDALLTSQQMEDDCVIEVVSSIDANANFHRSLRQFASQTAEKVYSAFSRLPQSDMSGQSSVEVYKLEYSLFRIQLCAPPTSSTAYNDGSNHYREGFIIALCLEDGSIGYGEVSPLETHQENLLDVEEQLRFMIHAIQKAPICYLLPLLKGSFSSWIWRNLGIPPASLFPSVRCGLEMAVLNAIAAKEGSSISGIIRARTAEEEKLYDGPLSVQICALIDSDGTPEDVAEIASELVKEGFNAIKLKVARRADPVDDAVVIQEVRKKVGPEVHLRADANRKWTYEQAIRFGSSVMNCKLQYIEEPVQDENDIIKFCEQTGLPVALDETIDNIDEKPLEKLAKFIHPGVVAIVIKPSVVGGFENAALLARWAQQLGKMSVVSATFESSIGLSAYVQFSSYLEVQNESMCKAMDKNPPPSIAHGLGTYRWLSEDVTSKPLKIQRNPYSGFIEASVDDAGNLLGKLEFNHQAIVRNFIEEEVLKYTVRVDSVGVSISIHVQELGLSNQDDVLVFLHGFLGTGGDWLPIMKTISGTARCIAVDLPGHGRSKMLKHDIGEAAREEPKLTIEVVADIIEKLLTNITPRKVTIVGYSMGARIALYMALRCSSKVKRAVIVSGSPGLEDMSARKVRSDIDDSRACSLIDHGLKHFVDSWYAGGLWRSLRSHPHFERIVLSRSQQADIFTIARVLSDLSAGRQPSLWEDLRHCEVALLLVVGEKDGKFKDIANKMFVEAEHGERRISDTRRNCEVVEVPMSGHAVHIENPLFLARTIRQFLGRPLA